MIEISKYLQDGANYQAQAVLAIMRAREAEVRSYCLKTYNLLKSLYEPLVATVARLGLFFM